MKALIFEFLTGTYLLRKVGGRSTAADFENAKLFTNRRKELNPLLHRRFSVWGWCCLPSPHRANATLRLTLRSFWRKGATLTY